MTTLATSLVCLLQLPANFTKDKKFFFPALMVGPSFDYVDYQRWIETTMFEVPTGTDPANRPKTRKQRKIPQSGTPAAIKAGIGLTWIVLFLQFSKWYNTDLVLGDEYMRYGFLRRVWLLEMLGFSTRMKYYGVWYLTEGACILSGMGYKGINPKTGKVDWNRLQNVNPWGIESAQNSRAYLEGWNMNTNNWLRNYMYLRVTPKGKKPGFRASLATFVTSAFWHGFAPGYYLTFVLAAFLQTIAKSKVSPENPCFLHAVFRTRRTSVPAMHSLQCMPTEKADHPQSRLPSAHSTLFPHPRRPTAHSLQTYIRLSILCRNASSLLLHYTPFRRPHPPCLPSGLVPRVLLHHRWCRSLNGLLRAPRY